VQVDEAPMRDREEPAAEAGLITLESAQSCRSIEPDLRRKVLPDRLRLRSEVAKQSGLELPVQKRERPGGTCFGCRQNAFEPRL
jgi:hypothetical protein